MGAFAALVLFSMMALTAVDVFVRKAVGTSVTGSLELTELLMLLLIFAGLPLASIKGEHVLFDLLDRFLPTPLRRAQHRLSHGICMLLLLGAGWLTWERAGRTMEQGDETAQLALAIGPFQYVAAGLVLATALVHAWLMLQPAAAVDAEEEGVPAPGAT